MRIEKIEGKEERAILIGMIVSNQVCSRIATQYEKGMFKSRWSDLVGGWAVNHYKKYGKAPNEEIETYFNKWAEKSKEKEVIGLVGKFLSGLDESYKKYKKKINPDTLIDQAAEYFDKVKILKLRDAIEEAIDEGEVDKAREQINKWAGVEMGEDETIDPYLDVDVHKQTYNARKKPLFRMKGAMGDFFGDQFARENFIAFEGSEKAGKSFCLQEVCHQATRHRLRTAFFGIGDMSKTQTMQRWQARLTRRPIKKGKYDYPLELKAKNFEYSKIKREVRRCEKNLTFREIEEARSKFARHHIRSDEHFFRMKCKPELGLDQIKSYLQSWKDREGWEPDIIAIDYADLLNPPKGKRSKVEEVDENWRQMRFMALNHHCLMLTATQVRRSGYKKRWLGIDDTADSKTKVAHVTGFIGINFDDKEWNTQRRRYNWIRIREITKRQYVQTAGCLAIANPWILSV